LEELLLDNTSKDRYYRNSNYSDARYNVSIKHSNKGMFSPNDAYNVVRRYANAPAYIETSLPNSVKQMLK
jgi:hypothetical protein